MLRCFGYKRSKTEKRVDMRFLRCFGYKWSKKGGHEICLRVLALNEVKMVDIRFVEMFWLQTE